MTNKITIFSIAAALATFTATAQSGGSGAAGGTAGTGSSGTGAGSGTGVGNAGVGNSATPGNSGNATGGALPSGLQNRSAMPPGLQNGQQNGQLPPGLASRTNGMGSGLDTNALGITSEQGLFPNQAQVNTRSNQWGVGPTNGLWPTSRTNSQRGIYALTNRFGMNTNLPPTGLTNGAARFGMPPGLDEREQMPAGLDQRQQLPPGLQGRTNGSGSGL